MSTDNEKLWLVARTDRRDGGDAIEASWVFRTRAAAERFRNSRPEANRDKYVVRATKWGPEA